MYTLEKCSALPVWKQLSDASPLEIILLLGMEQSVLKAFGGAGFDGGAALSSSS